RCAQESWQAGELRATRRRRSLAVAVGNTPPDAESDRRIRRKKQPAGLAYAAAFFPNISRSSRFSTLPVAVRGRSSSVSWYEVGILNFASVLPSDSRSSNGKSAAFALSRTW